MELDGRKEKDGGGPIIQPAKCVLLFKLREIITAQLLAHVKLSTLTYSNFQKNSNNDPDETNSREDHNRMLIKRSVKRT